MGRFFQIILISQGQWSTLLQNCLCFILSLILIFIIFLNDNRRQMILVACHSALLGGLLSDHRHWRVRLCLYFRNIFPVHQLHIGCL